jgi:tRNA(adenine34) deaminase
MEEVPVGAVVVCDERVIARAHNYTERLNDFTAHAEMQAFTSASEYLGGKYLNECTLYVTLEPCVMCMGAAYNTKIGRIVYGASDPKRGFQRIANQAEDLIGFVHPKSKITGGILAQECAALLQQFFEERRSEK